MDFLGIDGGKPYFESLALEGDDALPKAAEIIVRLGSVEPQASKFRTLVIDSAESLSHLVFKKAERERLAELRTAEPMAAGSYKGSENHFITNRQGLLERGEGFKEFLNQNFENVIRKGIHVLFIAGSETDKKTGKHRSRLWTTSKGFGVRSALVDYCDDVLFCERRFPDGERFQGQQELSGSKEWEFAKGKSETVIHTADSSKHFAKKGIELPAEIAIKKTGFEFGEFLRDPK